MSGIAAPYPVAPGVYRMDVLRLKDAVTVVLLENDDGWTLVDTGLASSPERILAGLRALGSGPEDLRRIFLTHQHDDHTGGLPGILERAPHAEVGTTEHEAEVVSGRRPYDPPSNPVMRRLVGNAMPQGAPVGRVLAEGDLVSGFRLIPTPGHTRGHASLLRDGDGLLLTADAFGCFPRRLRVGVRKGFCTDPPEARRSAERLLGEDFATAVPVHGPVMRGPEARRRLAEAVRRCRY